MWFAGVERDAHLCVLQVLLEMLTSVFRQVLREVLTCVFCRCWYWCSPLFFAGFERDAHPCVLHVLRQICSRLCFAGIDRDADLRVVGVERYAHLCALAVMTELLTSVLQVSRARIVRYLPTSAGCGWTRWKAPSPSTTTPSRAMTSTRLANSRSPVTLRTAPPTSWSRSFYGRREQGKEGGGGGGEDRGDGGWGMAMVKSKLILFCFCFVLVFFKSQMILFLRQKKKLT